MDDVITVPPPTSILTCAVVAPRVTSRIVPLMMLRALRRILVFFSSVSCLLTPAGCRYRDPRSRGQPDGLEMAGDLPILGAQVHVHVGLLRGEDAAMLP
jgi:hypothetical protein